MRKIHESQDIDHPKAKILQINHHSKTFLNGSTKKIINLTIPGLQLKGKQYYKKQSYCMICYKNFTKILRQHHCRICSNSLCHDCSRSQVNKQRVCDICIIKLNLPEQDKKKQEILNTLQILCAFLIYRKDQKMNQLEQLKQTGIVSKQEYNQEIIKQKSSINKLINQNNQLQNTKQIIQNQLEQIKQRNAKIQDEIQQIQQDLGSIDNVGSFI